MKSGWDQYGYKVGIPTQHLIIRRVTCISPFSALIALGSEMSGGIQDVRAEDITAIDTESIVRVKTALGRGGYVKDIYVRRMTLKNMKYAFWKQFQRLMELIIEMWWQRTLLLQEDLTELRVIPSLEYAFLM